MPQWFHDLDEEEEAEAEPTVEGGQAKLERGPPAVGGLRP
jgi:hypothetical protein